MKKNDFLVMWCCEGLECIIDLTQWRKQMEEWEKKTLWAQLKDQKCDPAPKIPLPHMITRARANPQRLYEIYTFSATDGITKDDIESMFETSPQAIADLIREKGYKVYEEKQPVHRISRIS